MKERLVSADAFEEIKAECKRRKDPSLLVTTWWEGEGDFTVRVALDKDGFVVDEDALAVARTKASASHVIRAVLICKGSLAELRFRS
jgi:hypothetical protein